jgi:dienelactone hydrolase
MPAIQLALLAGLAWPYSSEAQTTESDMAGIGLPRPALSAAYARPGPFAVEVRDVNVSRTAAGGGDFAALLFVPLPIAGAATMEASPVVAFGHGYLTPVDRYASSLRHLASWGLTVIAPRSAGGLLPDHAGLAADLSTAGAWVVTAADADDWPGLPVDAHAFATSGHSMGGGAAVLAAAADPRVVTVATLAAADTRPSAIEAAGRLKVPALFVAGSDDSITPPDQHQRPMFEATVGVPAEARVIDGGSHCGFLDDPILPGIICDSGRLDPDEQSALSRTALVSWLRWQLMADEAAAALAWPAGPLEGLEVSLRGSLPDGPDEDGT